MNNTLFVYWADRKVGRLWLTDGSDFVFQYDSDWVASGEALPISLRLPVRKDPFGSPFARSFFSNLLPEGLIRESIAKRLGVAEKNDFRLLEELGGECAGALCLLPAGKTPDAAGGYEAISKKQIDGMIDEMPRKPFLMAKKGLRLSLAGAQQKLPVYLKGGSLFLPQGAFSSSHILKPEIPGYEDTGVNEAFCMLLAKECGLPVPKVEIWRGRHRALLVQRYDRTLLTGTVTRLHQEDFCQALGYACEQKYESDGGPGLKECFALLARHSVEPILDRRNLLRWVVFNALIGNCDAHAKNLSLLITLDGIRLAPFYDLMSTRVYPDLSDKLAMKIGGENRSDWLMKGHWERMAMEADVGAKAVWGAYQDLQEMLSSAAVKVQKAVALQVGESAILGKIMRQADARGRRFTAHMTEKTSHGVISSLADDVMKYAVEITAADEFLHEPVARHFVRLGGWEVQVYPVDYQVTRFPDPRDVKRLIRKSEVSLRGWNFPHTDKGENSSYFLNGWQSLTDWPGHSLEGYRAYQSGLVVWKAVFREDLTDKKNKPSGKVLSCVNVISEITEIFLFLRNYYEAQSAVRDIRVRLALHGTAKRRLASFRHDVLREDLIAQEPQIVLAEDIKMQDLKDSCLVIANRFIRHIFLLFGWEEITAAAVTDWQRKLLRGK